MRTAHFLLPLVLAATPVLAQTPPAAGGTTTGTAGTVMAAPQGTPAGAPATAAQMPPAKTAQGKAIESGVDRRITELHNRLKITQAEQGVWNDFADTMRQNAIHADQVFSQQVAPGQQDALQSMRAYAQITQAHAEDVSRLLPKFEALYNALSPEQKKAADATFAEYQRQMMRNTTHHAS